MFSTHDVGKAQVYQYPLPQRKDKGERLSHTERRIKIDVSNKRE